MYQILIVVMALYIAWLQLFALPDSSAALAIAQKGLDQYKHQSALSSKAPQSCPPCTPTECSCAGQQHHLQESRRSKEDLESGDVQAMLRELVECRGMEDAALVQQLLSECRGGEMQDKVKGLHPGKAAGVLWQIPDVVTYRFPFAAPFGSRCQHLLG